MTRARSSRSRTESTAERAVDRPSTLPSGPNSDSLATTVFSWGNRTDWIWAGAIFALAFVARVAFLVDYSDNPTFSIPLVDEETHDQRAWLLARHGEWHPDFFWQPIYYPLTLAAIYKVAGHSILTARIFQCVLGAITCSATFWLGTRTFSRTVGVLAGVMTALYGPLIYFESSLVAAGWAALFSVLLLLQAGWIRQYPSARLFFFFGLTGIVSTLNRSTALPFFLVVSIWLVIELVRRWPLRDVSRWLAASLLGFMVVAWPTSSIMKREAEVRAITPLSGGVNFYIGNNPDTDRTINIRPGFEWTQLLAMPDREGIHDAAGRQRYFYHLVREFARNEPAAFFGGMWQKTLRYISSRELPRNDDLYLMHRWSPLLRLSTWKLGSFGFPFGLLFPLAIVGLALGAKQIPIEFWLYVLAYPAAVILVFVTSRYRAEAIPVFAIIAALGCVQLYTAIQQAHWRSLAISAVLAAIAIVAGVAPGPFAEETVNYEAELNFNLGTAYRDRQRDQEALEMFQLARQLNPQLADATNEIASHWFRIATKEFENGRTSAGEELLARAEQETQHALEVHPHHPVAFRNLAAIAKAREQHANTIEYAQKSIDQDPTVAYTYYLKGYGHLQIGADPATGDAERIAALREAIASLRRAIELDSKLGVAHYYLATQYNLIGDHEQAMAHYMSAGNNGYSTNSMLRQIAWIGATSPSFRLNHPQRALEAAKAACSKQNPPPPLFLDTLAAALANANQFEPAIQTAQLALSGARASSQWELAQQIEARLALYRQRRPYREQPKRIKID